MNKDTQPSTGQKGGEIPTHLTAREYTQYKLAVQSGNLFELKRFFAQFYPCLSSERTGKIPVQQLLHVLVQILIEQEKESLESFKICIDLLYREQDWVQDTIQETLLELSSSVSVAIAMAKDCEGREPDLIDTVIQYINKNYADESMTLNSTADNLGFSAGYLGDYFKKVTGQNFTNYVVKVRMEKGKALLNIDAGKTYEIALACGFVNAHYFSVVFKKTTGMTPSEYRNHHKNVKSGKV